MEPNQAPDFAEAFPDGLATRVRAALEATSLTPSTQKRTQVTAKEQRVVIVRAFIKKTEKTPTGEIDPALQRAKELKP